MTSGMPSSAGSAPANAHPLDAAQGIWKVITASSVGTMIEWYDFYIFGSLAAIISTQFFPGDNPTASFLKTLATFAVGFAVRPFGALVFGRIGDLTGRKFAFLATLLIMGGSTAAIGFLPGYNRIGIAAPIVLVILRLLQGLRSDRQKVRIPRDASDNGRVDGGHWIPARLQSHRYCRSDRARDSSPVAGPPI